MARIPVETVLTARDVNTSRIWGELTEAAQHYHQTLDQIKQSFGLFQSLALGGGVALSLESFVKINKEMEESQQQLAGNIAVYQYAKNYNDALLIADDTLKKIKDDAAKLPGEDSDFIQAFSVTFPAQAELGIKSLDEIINRSDKLVAILKTKGVDAGQAARDIALMLRGHAGADVRSFMELKGQMGIKDADEFNKKSAQERLKLLDTVLGKNKESIDAFAHTWEALTSTSKSYFKELLTVGTTPLFEAAKDNLAKMNTWYEKSKPHIMEMLAFYQQTGKRAFNSAVEFATTALTPRDYAVKALEDSVGPAFERITKLGDKVIDLLPDAARIVSDAGSALLAMGTDALPSVIAFAEAVVGATGGMLEFSAQLFHTILPAIVDGAKPWWAAIETDIKAAGTYLGDIGEALDPRKFKRHWNDLFDTMIEATEKGQTGLDAWDSFLALAEEKEKRAQDLANARNAHFAELDKKEAADRREEELVREIIAEKEKQWQADQAKKRADQLKKKPQVVQDFRGSRFTIEQRFAQGIDPGRVLTAVREDAQKLAQKRLTAGITPLFGHT